MRQRIPTPCEARGLNGRFGALRPDGCRFESHSSRHVGTLGKSFIRSPLLALQRVNSNTVSMR